jgi:hypothetical protein
MSSEEMGDLQALVTGSIMGALMAASSDWLDIIVEPVTDENGYRPEVYVRGIVSGEVVRVRIEREP